MSIEELKKIILKMPKRVYTSERDFQLTLAMKFEEEYGNVVANIHQTICQMWKITKNQGFI